MAIEVVKPGLLTTLQAGGRIGYAHLGVSRAGAFDAPALRIANALCGNPRDACGLEMTLLGPTLRFDTGAWIAVTGAPIAFTVDGQVATTWAPVPVPAGATVVLGQMAAGCRSYLAVRNGLEVESVLGSRSTDLNSALGPFGGRALHSADILEIAGTGGAPTVPAREGSGRHLAWHLDPRPWFDAAPEQGLRILPGRHLESLTLQSRQSLFADVFSVLADSNRVGLRLAGPKLEFATVIEMLSEASVPGLLQLPPSGQPIAFGPECPVSGGYPRLGQIIAVDLPRLAQLRPGDKIRFEHCSLEQAWQQLTTRERALQSLESAILQRLPHRS